MPCLFYGNLSSVLGYTVFGGQSSTEQVYLCLQTLFHSAYSIVLLAVVSEDVK